MKRRSSRGRVHDIAESYLGRLDPEGRRFTSRAASAWNEVVGPDIARHTMGVSLRDGELLVYVDGPVWANELSLMAEEFRERINEVIGKDLVRSVRFSVSRKVREERMRTEAEEEAEQFYRPDAAEPVPLSEQERSQVEHMAAAIHDPEVREAAVRAMTRHLEWKKGIRSENGAERPSE